MHLHNEAVLAFLRLHADWRGVQRFAKEQDAAIKAMNRAAGTDYEGHVDYLKRNVGDDADVTMEELARLLREGEGCIRLSFA